MRTVPLGQVAKFIRGVTFKPSDVLDRPTTDSVGVMRTKNVQSTLDIVDVLHIPRDLVRRGDQYLGYGDILISSANSWNLVGRCSWVPELASPAAIGGFVAGLRVTSDGLDPRYLYHWFSSPRVQAEVRNTANQTTNIANLNLHRCALLQLPLPPLEEQRRIAAILDQADAIRVKHRRMTTLLQDLAQAVFIDMFGEESADSFRPVAEVCERITVGVVIKPASHYVETGVPALRTLNIKVGSIDQSELVYFSEESNDGPLAKSKLRTGDVVVSRTGRAGVAAVVPACLAGANAIDLIIVTPRAEVLNSLYFEGLLNSQFGARLVAGEQRGQVQQHFNVGSLKAAQIPVPSMTFQRLFADKIRHIRGLQSQVGSALTNLDALFASLQFRAFSGQL